MGGKGDTCPLPIICFCYFLIRRSGRKKRGKNRGQLGFISILWVGARFWYSLPSPTQYFSGNYAPDGSCSIEDLRKQSYSTLQVGCPKIVHHRELALVLIFTVQLFTLNNEYALKFTENILI